MDRYELQGKCLVGGKEPAFITNIFDQLPFQARERLRNSPYDLCCACISDICERLSFDDGRRMNTFSYAVTAIDRMEAQIRCEEAPQSQ